MSQHLAFFVLISISLLHLSFSQVTSCPQNEVIINRACRCLPPNIRVNGICEPSCPPSTFLDLKKYSCEPCDSSCSGCWGPGPNQCLSCAQGSGLLFNPFLGTCERTCTQGVNGGRGYCVGNNANCTGLTSDTPFINTANSQCTSTCNLPYDLLGASSNPYNLCGFDQCDTSCGINPQSSKRQCLSAWRPGTCLGCDTTTRVRVQVAATSTGQPIYDCMSVAPVNSYVPAGEDTYFMCSAGCAVCSGAPDNCVRCDDGLVVSEDGTTCVMRDSQTATGGEEEEEAAEEEVQIENGGEEEEEVVQEAEEEVEIEEATEEEVVVEAEEETTVVEEEEEMAGEVEEEGETRVEEEEEVATEEQGETERGGEEEEETAGEVEEEGETRVEEEEETAGEVEEEGETRVEEEEETAGEVEEEGETRVEEEEEVATEEQGETEIGREEEEVEIEEESEVEKGEDEVNVGDTDGNGKGVQMRPEEASPVMKQPQTYVESVVNYNNIGGTAVSVGVAGLQAFHPGSPSVVSTILLVNLLQYVRYLNINYPEKVALAFAQQGQNIGSINFGPKLPDSIANETSRCAALPRFSRFGVSGLFLTNFWRGVTTTLILAFGCLVAFLIGKIKCRNDYLILARDKLKSFLLWNFVLTFVLSNIDNVSIFAIVEYQSTLLENQFDILSLVINITYMVGSLFLLGYIPFRLYRLRKQDAYKNREDKLKDHDNIKILFEKFKNKYLIQEMFIFIIGFRTLLNNTIIVAIDSPTLQCSLLIVLGITMMTYLIVFRPNIEIVYDVELICYEIMIFIVNCVCLHLSTLDSSEQGNAEYAGNVILTCNLIVMTASLVFSVLKVMVQVWIFIKPKIAEMRAKRSQAKNPEKPKAKIQTQSSRDSCPEVANESINLDIQDRIFNPHPLHAAARYETIDPKENSSIQNLNTATRSDIIDLKDNETSS